MEKGGGLCPPPLRRGVDRPSEGGRPTDRPAGGGGGGSPPVPSPSPARCPPLPPPLSPPPNKNKKRIWGNWGDGGNWGGGGGRKYKNRKIENNSNGLTGNVTGLNVFRRVQTG